MAEYDSSVLEEQIKSAIILENTRMFFDFMEELDKRCLYELEDKEEYKKYLYFGEGGLSSRDTIVDKLKRKLTGFLKVLPDVDGFLRQNPLSHYIRFWSEWHGIEGDKDENGKDIIQYEQITLMLHYYQIIKYLAETKYENILYDDMPYLYEDICISIADMVSSKMCYTIYVGGENSKPQLITRSGYLCNSDEQNDEIEFDKTLHEIRCCMNSQPKLNPFGICICGNLIAIKLPYAVCEEHEEDEAKCFYLLLHFDPKTTNLCDKEPIDIIRICAKILFLRDRLMEVLRRDYATLLNYRFDCSYIKSIDEKFSEANSNAEHKTGFPYILHISDLHVTNDSSWDTTSKRCSQFLKKLEEEQKIDLLAITGDIVNGSYSASSARHSYRKASAFIRKVAEELWSVETGGVCRLSHDWKRRIMITTGNHDYLTMNELVSSSKARKTKLGEPDLSSSTDTLVKFTYFIGMLMEFLDAPIDTLIDNDLNEFRYYRNLNLKVLSLNSVSNANVLQNNKVGINRDKVELLLRLYKNVDGENGPYQICLVHHGPKYKIDYIADAYEIWKYDDNEKNTELTRVLQKAYMRYRRFIAAICKGVVGNRILQIQDDYQTAYSRLKNKIDSSYREDNRNEWVTRFLKSDIYTDMTELYIYLQRSDRDSGYKDEFITFLNGKFHGMYDMIGYDTGRFRKTMQRIIETASNILFLSGHVHSNDLSLNASLSSSKYRVYKHGIYSNFIIAKAEYSFAVVGAEKGQYTWKVKPIDKK